MLFEGIKIRRKQKVAGNENTARPSDLKSTKSEENKKIKCKEKLVNNPKAGNETDRDSFVLKKPTTSQKAAEETKTFNMNQLVKALQKSTTDSLKQEKLQPKLVEQRQQLNYIAQHIQNIAGNIMDHTFNHFEEYFHTKISFNASRNLIKNKNPNRHYSENFEQII